MLEWNRQKFVWNVGLGRTPEEIDAYCQVIGDTQASTFCAGQPDFNACFDRERRESKAGCVANELLKEEQSVPEKAANAFEQVVLAAQDAFANAISRGETPSPDVMQKAGALPAAPQSVEAVSAEIEQSPPSRYPAGAGSTATKDLQRQINVRLLQRGLCPIKPDGVLGPATCGAARAVGITPPSTCTSFTEPKRCGAPSASMISSSSSGKALPWILGGVAVLGVGALLIARR